MEQKPHRACKWAKSNWPHVVLFRLAHYQCNGIIKGWLHCLTSDSKWRFLVNIMLMFGSAWCLVMVQIQSPLIKKKINSGRPEHSLTPPFPYSPTSDNISFLPYPLPTLPPLKVDAIYVSSLYWKFMYLPFSASLLMFFHTFVLFWYLNS